MHTPELTTTQVASQDSRAFCSLDRDPARFKQTDLNLCSN
jgi:hypothetical protein